MHCNTCNTDVAARVLGRIDTKTGKYFESCDVCAKVAAFWMPDVFLGGPGGSVRTDEHLCSPTTGEPIPFTTKREKAAIMKMLNVRQADGAEHQHGARNETKRRKYI